MRPSRGEGFLLALLEASRDLVFVKDRASRIVWGNRAFLEFTGMTVEQLDSPAQPPSEFHAAYREADARVFMSGEIVETPEEPARRADGALRWLHTVKTPIHGEGGAVERIVAVARDVTEARETRLTLARLNECLLAFGPDPVENVSRLTALCGELLDADAAVYDRLDKGVLSAVGQWKVPEDFNSVLPAAGTLCESVLARGDDGLVTVCGLPAAGRDGQVSGHGFSSFAGRAVRCGGRPLGVLYAMFRRDVADDARLAQVLGVVSTAIAVEEERARGEKDRSRLAEELRQAQKLESLGRMAGGIAHDFNNSLTTISGYAELLRQSAPDEESRRDVAEILRSVEYAAALTRQLLAFGRRQMLLPRVVDLNETVRSLSRMLRRLIGEDIVIEMRPCADEARVFADPSQLEQVLMNLALNARDAMPGGGSLTVETSLVEPGEVPPGEDGAPAGAPFVRMSVRDTGSGISAEVLPRIFEPFFTTKEQGKGTGLGLATVYGIVAQSGGRVTCESSPGTGSVFRVYLPLCPRPVTTPRPAPGPGAAGKGRVLLVEDDVGIRGMASRVLQSAGYEVVAASTADEALDLCEAPGRGVDALVTDVVMPGLNGHQLAKRLEKVHPRLKVVYMSGYTDDDALRDALRRGAAFIQKPFNPADLCRVLKDVLSERTPAPS